MMNTQTLHNKVEEHVYRVGGWVRDHILGIESNDSDWVVVGLTPAFMLEVGFRQVGADFPVFINETGDEYALARTERKSAPGYKGFEVHANASITLEDDLLRRDLTINAMAIDKDGNLIDPYNGRGDLANKVLRHVSPAFIEDPLRVLRVARFAARFDFSVADETMLLMRKLVNSGELNELTPERVWNELLKALGCNKPSRFFEVLDECGALLTLLPELHRLKGVPQVAEYHPEVDTFIHTMLSLDKACELNEDKSIRFAALVHDLGKGITDKAMLPKHHGHEQAGVPLVQEVCDRLKVPSAFKKLALDVTEFHLKCHRVLELRANSVVKFLDRLGAFRDPSALERFTLACQADAQGRTGLENKPYPQAEYLHKALAVTSSVTGKEVVKDGYSGVKVGEEIYRRRIELVKAIKN